MFAAIGQNGGNKLEKHYPGVHTGVIKSNSFTKS